MTRGDVPRSPPPAHRPRPIIEWPEAARKAFAWPAARRSLLVAMIVGTAVNAINQGPELLAGGPPVIWKLALTYLMPFLVASYGTYAALRDSR